ncbi:MAG: hypothetical protein PVJ27_00425 [Candidatus Brocadiaceae bacterium]
MALNPANLTEVAEAEPLGSLRTILTFAIYGAFVVGLIAYLLWKLPRGEGDGTP